MRRRVVLFFAFVLAIVFFLAFESLFFIKTRGISLGKSEIAAAVRIIGLPDMAVATEARFLRFRSLSDIFAPFNEGPEMLDYFPAAFTYAPSPITRKLPSTIKVDK